MTTFEKKLQLKLKDIPRDVAPGFRLMVASEGKMVANINWGTTYSYYDLASLTKIIFTATQFMGLESQKKIHVDEAIQKYLAWYPYSGKIKQLLNHTAGNVWWMPFYKSIATLKSNYEKKQKLKEMIRDLRPKKTPHAVYSDIDFFLLGFLLEEVRESSLEHIWSEFLVTQLPDNQMHFNSNTKSVFTKTQYAPTEKCLWRKKDIRAEVHDENTWALGGVSSHAGLFGRAEDVMQWGLWLRAAHKRENTFTRPAVVEKFTRRSLPQKYGDWSLGFMMPTKGSASCGSYFDLGSVGHTGFTGTSFWWDKKNDVIVVLLSNRIHPTRKNEKFRAERPRIHNMVFETIKGI